MSAVLYRVWPDPCVCHASGLIKAMGNSALGPDIRADCAYAAANVAISLTKFGPNPSTSRADATRVGYSDAAALMI